MNDGRQTPPSPEAWKIRFLANGTPGTWFYTDDAAVTKEWLRAHCDDVEVIPCAVCMTVPFSGNTILMSSAPHWPECSICTTYCRNEPGTEKISMMQNVFVKSTKPPAGYRHPGKIQTHTIIRLFYVDPDFLALIPL